MADKKDNIVLSIRDMSKSFGRNRVLPRSGKTYLFPIQEDISFVFLIGTEKTLHHR